MLLYLGGILAGVALILLGLWASFRLYCLSKDQQWLEARVRIAQSSYDTIRQTELYPTWRKKKARNDLYFRRLDLKLKKIPKVFRQLMFLGNLTVMGVGAFLVLYSLHMLGIF